MNELAVGRLAYVSALARQAIICSPDGIYRLSVGGSITEHVPSSELGRMLNLFPDVDEHPADGPPFRDVLARLRLNCQVDGLVRLALSLFDDDHSLGLRARSSALLEERLAEDGRLGQQLLVRLLSMEGLVLEQSRPFGALAPCHSNVLTLLCRWLNAKWTVRDIRQALEESLAALMPGVQEQVLNIVRRRNVVGWLALPAAEVRLERETLRELAQLRDILDTIAPAFGANWFRRAEELNQYSRLHGLSKRLSHAPSSREVQGDTEVSKVDRAAAMRRILERFTISGSPAPSSHQGRGETKDLMRHRAAVLKRLQEARAENEDSKVERAIVIVLMSMHADEREVLTWYLGGRNRSPIG